MYGVKPCEISPFGRNDNGFWFEMTIFVAFSSAIGNFAVSVGEVMRVNFI
jgi:hypothetical protein